MYLPGCSLSRHLAASLVMSVGFIFMAACSRAVPAFAPAVTNGTVNISGLSEASGLVASRNNDSVLWTHNDSGDTARIFCLDTHGRKLGIYAVTGGVNVDYEDIAIGPGPVTNVSYLYIGDIGDNNSVRANIVVYQVPEPAVYARQFTAPANASLKGVRAITLTYPDGARNAEAMFVDPVTGDLFILSKASTSRVYTAPKSKLDATNNIVLTFVRTLSFDVPSAADISPSGNEIIVRQEDFARMWLRADGQSISSALGGTAIVVPVTGTAGGEPNGEAVGFDSIGLGYFTLSDSSTVQPLRYFARTSGDGPRVPQPIVAAGGVWKYLDDGTDPGPGWSQSGFDDSGWNLNAAPFGYGNGDEQTQLNYGPDPNNKHSAAYFRKSFVLDNAPCLGSLSLKLVVDDGAAVYLNGTNVARVQLAPGAGNGDWATQSQPPALGDTWMTIPIDPAALVNGTNVVAVEVHPSSGADPTLRFDLQLGAMESTTPRFLSWVSGTNELRLQLCGPSGTNVTVQASADYSEWAQVGSAILTNGLGWVTDQPPAGLDARVYRAFR
ncbi:MAG: hypothetical protein U1F98_03495 [Verrucomicrobiota bacterium]